MITNDELDKVMADFWDTVKLSKSPVTRPAPPKIQVDTRSVVVSRKPEELQRNLTLRTVNSNANGNNSVNERS